MAQENKIEFLNAKLFEYIYDIIISSGGDGDAMVGFMYQDYKAVALEFEKFLKTKLGHWTTTINEDSVVFHDNQEYFVFTNKETFNKTSSYEVRVLTY